ncbi:MAG: DinB family protein [Vicinamibacterales bacterium]
MQLTVIAALLALVTVPQAPPSPSAPNVTRDRDAAVKYLEETRDAFVKSIDGLSEAQWTFKPGPDRWSIAEVAEHIALSEPMLLQLVSEKVMKAPKPAVGAAKATDQQVIALVTDRTQKAQAPETLRPTNRWAAREALTKDFLAARQKTIDYVKSTDDPRAHAVPHPALEADVDGHQWVLYLAGHSARHTAQLNEVQTSAGYPMR